MRALRVLFKQYPLASDEAKESWRIQVEAAEDPRAEVTRIQTLLRLLEKEGYCPLTKKLKNVRLPISVVKDRRQKAAVLAKWKAEVEESRGERISSGYTDLPELET